VVGIVIDMAQADRASVDRVLGMLAAESVDRAGEPLAIFWNGLAGELRKALPDAGREQPSEGLRIRHLAVVV
jgi:hypothetical protein